MEVIVVGLKRQNDRIAMIFKERHPDGFKECGKKDHWSCMVMLEL